MSTETNGPAKAADIPTVIDESAMTVNSAGALNPSQLAQDPKQLVVIVTFRFDDNEPSTFPLTIEQRYIDTMQSLFEALIECDAYGGSDDVGCECCENPWALTGTLSVDAALPVDQSSDRGGSPVVVNIDECWATEDLPGLLEKMSVDAGWGKDETPVLRMDAHVQTYSH